MLELNKLMPRDWAAVAPPSAGVVCLPSAGLKNMSTNRSAFLLVCRPFASAGSRPPCCGRTSPRMRGAGPDRFQLPVVLLWCNWGYIACTIWHAHSLGLGDGDGSKTDGEANRMVDSNNVVNFDGKYPQLSLLMLYI
jgi:hypothetical protein